MDPIIVLTPVAVLAIVLLLGFAGCDRVFSLPPVEPPPPPFLTLRVRVPVALVVRELIFTWDPPNTPGSSKKLTKPTPTSFDGTDNLFDLDLTENPDMGAWSARCRVIVQGGTGMGSEGMGSFTLDGSLRHPVATFVAMGDAPGLVVTFDNVYDEP